MVKDREKKETNETRQKGATCAKPRRELMRRVKANGKEVRNERAWRQI